MNRIRRILCAAAFVPPLGAAALAQPAQTSPSAAQPTVVTVQLSEYRFAPNEIDLDHGQAYVLHLTNTGERDHAFGAKAFFKAASVSPASAPWVRGGAVEVAQGSSVDITLTAPAAGTYDLYCNHSLHMLMGMKGQIVVR